ncbi:hypothetical protein BKA63DRAFT_314943 [Paraphoma chrysanthemicola]|nr:hypothetical protein BKA63DRAFT_314943 [Paraphoma chrysanthemicola]
MMSQPRVPKPKPIGKIGMFAGAARTITGSKASTAKQLDSLSQPTAMYQSHSAKRQTTTNHFTTETSMTPKTGARVQNQSDQASSIVNTLRYRIHDGSSLLGFILMQEIRVQEQHNMRGCLPYIIALSSILGPTYRHGALVTGRIQGATDYSRSAGCTVGDKPLLALVACPSSTRLGHRDADVRETSRYRREGRRSLAASVALML